MKLELNEILSKSLLGNRKLINYKDCYMYDTYERIADCIENFEVRDDDIWVCSFPKSGTTWIQEMVWNITNDLDFEGAKIPIEVRFPYLESPVITTRDVETSWLLEESVDMNIRDPYLRYIESIAKYQSPRFIKTHLPFHLLPRQLRDGEKNCKIFYISRNPKDTCISYYHFFSLMMHFNCTFEDFCKLFLGDKVLYAPYWNHVNGYVNNKDNNNILCIKFEDMKCDLRSVMRKVAIFLGKTLKDEQSELLENHLSFANMKENPAVNYGTNIARVQSKKEKLEGTTAFEEQFMRSGEVGQWKATMSEELIKQFDDWTKMNANCS